MRHDEGQELRKGRGCKKLVILSHAHAAAPPGTALVVIPQQEDRQSVPFQSYLIFRSFDSLPPVFSVSKSKNAASESSERTQPRSRPQPLTTRLSQQHPPLFLTFAESEKIQPSDQRITRLICSSCGRSHGFSGPHADAVLITCATSTTQNASHVCNQPW